jgi:hypothetical protein
MKFPPVPGASLDALVGCRYYVLGHFGLQDLLHLWWLQTLSS